MQAGKHASMQSYRQAVIQAIRHTHIQTGKKTDIQAVIQVGKQTRQTDKQAGRHTYRQTGQVGKHTYIQAGSHTNKQTHIPVDRKTDIQSVIQAKWHTDSHYYRQAVMWSGKQSIVHKEQALIVHVLRLALSCSTSPIHANQSQILLIILIYASTNRRLTSTAHAALPTWSMRPVEMPTKGCGQVAQIPAVPGTVRFEPSNAT